MLGSGGIEILQNYGTQTGAISTLSGNSLTLSYNNTSVGINYYSPSAGVGNIDIGFSGLSYSGLITLNGDVNIQSNGGNSFALNFPNASETLGSTDTHSKNRIYSSANSLNIQGNSTIVANHSITVSSLLSKKQVLGQYKLSALDELNKSDFELIRYLDQPKNAKPTLSLIIDDLNPEKQYYLPSILNSGEGVDQYSFTSLVALGLKEEDSKVETLKQRVTELENEIKTLKAA